MTTVTREILRDALEDQAIRIIKLEKALSKAKQLLQPGQVNQPLEIETFLALLEKEGIA